MENFPEMFLFSGKKNVKMENFILLTMCVYLVMCSTVVISENLTDKTFS